MRRRLRMAMSFPDQEVLQALHHLRRAKDVK
jgi:hypothetical protein